MTQNKFTTEQDYIANFSNGILLVEHGEGSGFEEAIAAKVEQVLDNGMPSSKILFLSCGTHANRLRRLVSALGCLSTVATIEEICLSKVFNQKLQSFREDQQDIYLSDQKVVDHLVATLPKKGIYTDDYLAKLLESLQSNHCLLKGSPYQALLHSLYNQTNTHSVKFYKDVVADALAYHDKSDFFHKQIFKEYNLLIVSDFQDATIIDVSFLMTLKSIDTIIIGGDPRQNLNSEHAHLSRYPKAWARLEHLANPQQIILNTLPTHTECSKVLNLLQNKIGMKVRPLQVTAKRKGYCQFKPQVYFVENQQEQMDLIAKLICDAESRELNNVAICTYARSEVESIQQELCNRQITIPLVYGNNQSEFEFCTNLIDRLLVIASEYASQQDACNEALIEALLTFVGMPNQFFGYASRHLMCRYTSEPHLKNKGVVAIKFQRARALYNAFHAMLNRPQINTGIQSLLDSLVPVLKECNYVNPDHIDRYLENVTAALSSLGNWNSYKSNELQRQLEQRPLLLTTWADAINYNRHHKIIADLVPGKFASSLLTKSARGCEKKFAQHLFYNLLAQSQCHVTLIFRKDLYKSKSFNYLRTINEDPFSYFTDIVSLRTLLRFNWSR